MHHSACLSAAPFRSHMPPTPPRRCHDVQCLPLCATDNLQEAATPFRVFITQSDGYSSFSSLATGPAFASLVLKLTHVSQRDVNSFCELRTRVRAWKVKTSLSSLSQNSRSFQVRMCRWRLGGGILLARCRFPGGSGCVLPFTLSVQGKLQQAGVWASRRWEESRLRWNTDRFDKSHIEVPRIAAVERRQRGVNNPILEN